MTIRANAGAVLALLLFATPVMAEIATDYEAITQDGQTTHRVGFEDPSCGGECFIASLSCGPGTTVRLTLGDVASKLAAQAITREKRQIVLVAGKVSHGFVVEEMTFQEMTGSWSVDAREEEGQPVRLAAAIATAKVVKFGVGGEKTLESLPVDGNVKTWAKACQAL